MVERLKAASPGYPVQEFYGDYNHFVQNKRKEWADMCGADHHVCTYADYPGGDLNRDPRQPARSAPGATTPAEPVHRPLRQAARQPGPGHARLRRDRLAPGLPAERRFLGAAPDEPGPRFTAATFASAGAEPADGRHPRAPGHHQQGRHQPARGQRPTRWPTRWPTAPGARSRTHPAAWPAPVPAWPPTTPTRCPATSPCWAQPAWWCPTPGAGSGLQLNARLYDLHPDGTQVLMDRGVKRLAGADGTTTLDLHGAGWKFARGHRIRIELAQDDDPYIKSSVQAGALNLAGVTLSVPIREGSTAIGGRAPSLAGAALRAPRLASDQGPRARFRLRVRRAPARGAAAPDHYQVEARDTRSSRGRRLTSRLRGSLVRFRGRLGHTYRFRARAVNRAGVPGAVGLGPHDRAAGRRTQAAALPRQLAACQVAPGIRPDASRAPAGGAPASRCACAARASTWSGGARAGAARRWCASTAVARPSPSTAAARGTASWWPACAASAAA